MTIRNDNMPEHSIARRHFLTRAGMGMGSLALAGLLRDEGCQAEELSDHRGPARHVIHVFLNGGMSQVDTFDPKPELTRLGGQMLPFENLQTERRTGVALPSPFTFKQHGQSGIPVSDLFPHLSKCVDEMAVIRSMHAELPNHEMSLMLMNSGDQRLVRPSFGSWLTWGMGKRQPKSARVCRIVSGRAACRRSRQLAVRVFARCLSGNAG